MFTQYLSNKIDVKFPNRINLDQRLNLKISNTNQQDPSQSLNAFRWWQLKLFCILKEIKIELLKQSAASTYVVGQGMEIQSDGNSLMTDILDIGSTWRNQKW